MPDYRKIIVLHEQGVSQRQISKLTHSSRDVIRRVIKSVENAGMTLQTMKDLTDAEIAKLLDLPFTEKGAPDPLYEISYAFLQKFFHTFISTLSFSIGFCTMQPVLFPAAEIPFSFPFIKDIVVVTATTILPIVAT